MMRYTAHVENEFTDPLLGVGGPKIYVIWHESILAPIYLRAHCRIAILISRHRDADVLASVARHAGFGCVRGSTNNGGSEALRELSDYSRENHIVFTPDGPRGPRRVMAPGPVILAMRTGLPIVPIAMGYQKAWRMKTWDRFALPKPFSNVYFWMGSELFLKNRSDQATLDRDEVEEARKWVESELNRCTDSAEAWAAGQLTPPTSKRVYRDFNRGPIAPRSESIQSAA